MATFLSRFGTQLRTLRRARRMSQKTLSELLGCNPQHSQISRLERGENLPQHKYDVERLGEALNCTGAEMKRLHSAYKQDVLGPRGYDE
ncbi:MAG: helix-turn-helix domain-containing protein [Anaerolineae bacterium]|nr:helix-turn-helix domain-containing protein [Anaerolineae bacterium]